jgi:hypothetical protein
METLLVRVVQRSDDVPRKHGFSVADRWTEACLDVLPGLVEAEYARGLPAEAASPVAC